MSLSLNKTRQSAFTLLELLAIISIIAVLSSLLFPALSKARGRMQAIVCLNNTKQLTLGCQIYADDHADCLPYNLGMNGSSFRTNLNWVNNVMSWELDSDNTNLATLTEASLGIYLNRETSIFHCPSDTALSAIQHAAGWDHRIRSYSMNAMVGDAGHFSTNGVNVNNPDYKQFFKSTQIPHPADIFVFLDEHPDSIDDGYFLNKAIDGYNYARPAEWTDLPASFHDYATAFSFADGHSALHRWVRPATVPLAAPYAAKLPITIPAVSDEKTDFNWVLTHMSVQPKADKN